MSLTHLTLLFSVLAFGYANDARAACNNNHKTMTVTIREVKSRYQDQWLKHPEVVSVGIGLNADQQPAVIIGVKRLTPALKAAFPAEIEGYPVELQAMGSPRVE